MLTAQSHVIDNVPPLGWGRGRECTFLGALEAALAVTDHPTDYVDLMGFTALAFRTRWFKPPAERGREWCPSSPVGEMEEEIAAADRASGWRLDVRFPYTEEARVSGTADILASIDAGRPVLAYDAKLNLGVVWGYEDGGREVMFKGYGGEATIEPAKLGWQWILLGEFRGAPKREESVAHGLKMAGHNFRRGVGREGPGEYWYGEAAFERWTEDLSNLAGLSEEQRRKLFFVSWWNFGCLADARRAAVQFLSRHFGDAQPAFAEEADFLEGVMQSKDAFFGPWTGKSFEQWTPEVRRRECDVLKQAMEIEQRAFDTLSHLI